MKKMVCYVDGSYKPSYPNKVGSAIVIVKENDKTEEIFFSKEDKELAQMRNVSGELRASMWAIKIAVDRKYDVVEIHYDYEGIEKWCTSEWKTKNKYTKLYKDYYEKMSKLIKIEFVKCDAHSGDYYNDLADYFAKKSLEIDVTND